MPSANTSGSNLDKDDGGVFIISGRGVKACQAYVVEKYIK